jgi:transposase, IS30 family
VVGRPVTLLSIRREFWSLIGAGCSTEEAAARAGVSASSGRNWFRDSGGMSPISLTPPSGRYLNLSEREEIAAGDAAGHSVRAIAAHIGRDPSTVSRELRRPRAHVPHKAPYRAVLAQQLAEARARRPKPSRLAADPVLRDLVQDMLEWRMSPQQIAGRLPLLFPDDTTMRLSHEAIYRGLYLHGRGALRRELTQHLRTGRALRKPRRRVDARRERIKDMVMIADRPAEVEDRAVPGDWEGDLITGRENKSAIGTLVERATLYTLLLHLPDGHGAAALHTAITAAMADLPAQLRRSLTWDQGIEMAQHGRISIDTDLDIYFCDPRSPWQRGTNENTNGLLRQYFPKGTNLNTHTAADLAAAAHQLNTRPRKRLGYRTPAEAIAPMLLTGRVATAT